MICDAIKLGLTLCILFNSSKLIMIILALSLLRYLSKKLTTILHLCMSFAIVSNPICLRIWGTSFWSKIVECLCVSFGRCVFSVKKCFIEDYIDILDIESQKNPFPHIAIEMHLRSLVVSFQFLETLSDLWPSLLLQNVIYTLQSVEFTSADQKSYITFLFNLLLYVY